MKLTLNREKFEKHLNNVSKALDSNPHLVILKGMMIIASESNITLIASNGNLSIKEIIDVKGDFIVKKPGKIIVPGKLFIQLIKKQAKIINIFVEKNSLKIESECFKSSINLLEWEEYPKIDFDSSGKEFIIDSEIIKKAIKNVVTSAATERNEKIMLNGVNFKAQGQQLFLTATDSYRLAREFHNINNEINFEFTILAKNLKDFLPNDTKGEIAINISDWKILTSYKSTNVLLQLIDGIFPDVEKIVPQQFTNILKIDVNHLLDLLDKASTINNEYQNTLSFKMNNNQLTIESIKNEIGNVIVKTNNIEWSGEDFQITFNANFLKDAINKFDGEISLNFLGSEKLFMIKSDSHPNLIQLISPHRQYSEEIVNHKKIHNENENNYQENI